MPEHAGANRRLYSHAPKHAAVLEAEHMLSELHAKQELI